LAALRARIEGIERRPALEGALVQPRTGDADAFALPSGMLHEVFTPARRNAGAGLGFCLGASRGLVSVERPALLYLQLTAETAETGLPYGPGLASFGIDPAAVVLIRTATIIELLWAAEEGLACRAVAAVIADIGTDPKALDFTASRRLGMRAQESGGTMLMLRYGEGRAASAARLRWRVDPDSSAPAEFDDKAPGDSRWRLTLEKGLWRGKPNKEWLLGWTKDGFDILDIPDADRAPRAAPLPGANPAALGDRLAQTA
jgi:protein ImuA